jgi:hypothetical protein
VTEHSLETSAAEQLQTTSVADYIVQRIADEGVTHCFGVAGDYLFPMCNAAEHSPKSMDRLCQRTERGVRRGRLFPQYGGREWSRLLVGSANCRR